MQAILWETFLLASFVIAIRIPPYYTRPIGNFGAKYFVRVTYASIVQRYLEDILVMVFLLLWSAFLGRSYETHQVGKSRLLNPEEPKEMFFSVTLFSPWRRKVIFYFPPQRCVM